MVTEKQNRRQFLKTSAGLMVMSAFAGSYTIYRGESNIKHFDFRAYRPGKELADVQCVTPDNGFYLHTFYDVCPWSPSQKFLTVTKFPYQKKKPQWGDIAEVCVIDLENRTIKTVYKTKAWSYQLGANVQWGYQSDRYLYTNDIIDGKPVCVRIDLENDAAKAFSGPKYDLAPDEKSVISANLTNMNIHQYGYAIPDPPSGHPVPFTKDQMPHEGLWKTDLVKDQTMLLVPFPKFVEQTEDAEFYRKCILYLFHSKFNPQNTRVMQVLRGQINNEGRHASLFTLKTDGTDIIQCLSREKWNQKARLGGSGNHPNRHSDGEHIIMNCIPKWLGYQDMLFCSFRYDGSDFKVLSEKHLGSGHPSVNAMGRYLIADAYPKQGYVVEDNGEIPIRLLDLKNDAEQELCSIATDVGGHGKHYLPENKENGGSQYKLDPHPTWSRDYKKIAFNGAPQGHRQVFVADLSKII